jgi:hypothetical protein
MIPPNYSGFSARAALQFDLESPDRAQATARTQDDQRHVGRPEPVQDHAAVGSPQDDVEHRSSG